MRSLFVTAALLLIPAVAAAAPMCVPDSLDDYINNLPGGCEVGGALFSGFVAPPLFDPLAMPIDPTNVDVQPLAADPLNPGLEFVLNVNAGAGEFFEILIGYNVSGAVPGTVFTGNSLSITGSDATGDGNVTVVEDKCLEGSFDATTPTGCTGTPVLLIVFQDAFGADTSAQMTFALPVASLGVFKDIAIDAGLVGTASLGSATNQFALVQQQPPPPAPEPSVGLLLTSGVVGLLARRARLRARFRFEKRFVNAGPRL